MPGNFDLKFGVSSCLWADHDLCEGIAAAARFGIKYIELSSDSFAADAGDEEYLSGLEAAVHRNAVRLVQVHIGGDAFDLSTDEQNGSRTPLENLKACVRLLPRFDNPILVIHASDVIMLTDDRKRRLDTCKRNLAALVEFCAGHGAMVAVENVFDMTGCGCPAFLLGDNEAEYREIVNSVDSQHLGVHLDSGHAYISGDLVEMLEAAGDRLCSLHLSDNHGKTQRKLPGAKYLHWDEHLLPGEGDTDWRGFMQALRAIDYRGVVTLEVNVPGTLDQRIHAVLKAMEMLRGLW